MTNTIYLGNFDITDTALSDILALALLNADIKFEFVSRDKGCAMSLTEEQLRVWYQTQQLHALLLEEEERENTDLLEEEIMEKWVVGYTPATKLSLKERVERRGRLKVDLRVLRAYLALAFYGEEHRLPKWEAVFGVYKDPEILALPMMEVWGRIPRIVPEDGDVWGRIEIDPAPYWQIESYLLNPHLWKTQEEAVYSLLRKLYSLRREYKKANHTWLVQQYLKILKATIKKVEASRPSTFLVNMGEF